MMRNPILHSIQQRIKPGRFTELFCWMLALICLYFLAGNDGPSLCLLKAAGISWCPGCGIGHSIHYAMHGQWQLSFDAHVLGIPALCIILFRIYFLAIKNFSHVQQ